MKEYSGVARAIGVKTQEIETIEAIVVAVSGGRVRAQFRQARGIAPPGAGPARQSSDGKDGARTGTTRSRRRKI